MRHRKGNRKLNKPTDQRIALLRCLVLSLFQYERINTTSSRAKEARRMAEKLITLARDGSLFARRQALKILPNREVVKKLFSDIGIRMKGRNGGYTRIIKTGFRRGDSAEMAVLELVD